MIRSMNKIKLDSCRICLEQEGFRYIFEEQGNIRKKIVYCASVQVLEDDSLPKMICGQCLFYLDIAYAFKMECECTDRKLRDLLLKDKVEFDKNIYRNNTTTIEDGRFEYGDVDQTVFNNTKNCPINNIHFEKSIMEHIMPNKLAADVNSTKQYSENCLQEVSCSRGCSSTEETQMDDNDESILNLIVSKVYIEPLERNQILEDLSTKDTGEDIEQNILEEIDYISGTYKPKENSVNKVGRHITKKITGKLPQKLLQNNASTNKTNKNDKVVIEDTNLGVQFEDNNSTTEFDEIETVNVPVFIFEETVVTENFSKECIEASSKKLRNRIAKKKVKVKLKMTLRKNNRNVNIFKDYFKRTRPKRKGTTKEQLKNLDLSVENIEKTLEKTKEGFMCDICNKSFPFKSHLKRHLNKHTGVKSYSCDYCKQRFVNKYNLNVHMSKHTGEFPLKCGICNKGLPNPSLLKRHMTSHTGEQQFQCRYCSVKFRQSSSLRTHEKMHLYRPSYHCDVCYKVFAYTNSLAAHKKLHFGAQRFSCDICLSTFSRKSSLIRHMSDHTKSKKFKCKFCNLSFQSKSNYNCHVKTHCKYKCETCGEGFRYKSNFMEHVKKHKDWIEI